MARRDMVGCCFDVDAARGRDAVPQSVIHAVDRIRADRVDAAVNVATRSEVTAVIESAKSVLLE